MLRFIRTSAFASIGALICALCASPASAAATGSVVFTQPTGTAGSTDSIPVEIIVAIDGGSEAIMTDGSGNVTSGVDNADLIAAGIDPALISHSDVNVYFSCSGTFTTGCGGPPYGFDFAFPPSGLPFSTNLDLQPGSSTDFLFGTFNPTGGIAPYGTYTFYDAGIFAQYWDAQNNHLGDVAFFDTCASQTAACAFTRTVDHGPVAGGVPEPASWTLMIMGFGAIGAGLRRRRTVALVA